MPKICASVLLGVLLLLVSWMGRIVPAEQPKSAVNPYVGMQEREEVFEFSEKPSVKKDGGRWVISFSLKAACDATVAIVDKNRRVIRHLAAGVLGKNAPWPFKMGTLQQSVVWDGKDDDGKPAAAGCQVKVCLGLDARFEKLDTWALMDGIRVLAVGKEGEIYAICSTDITSSLRVFGRDGKYVRTIFPPPALRSGEAKLLPERFALIAWNKTTGGEYVPRRNRFGGGYDFDLTKYPAGLGSIKIGTIARDGKLYALYSPGRGSTTLFEIDTRDGSCPASGIVNLGDMASDGMAASPDGKYLYFAGRQRHRSEKNNPFSHAVMRLPLGMAAKPRVFIGEAATEGNDNAHFNGPSSIACDKDGNVFVGDSGNARIQVFKADGSYLKTIADVSGTLVGVSHKSGAIYLMYQQLWTKNPRIIKLGGLDHPVKVAELEISCGGEWREGKQGAILSSLADPPFLWFAGTSYRGAPVIAGVEDRGKTLVNVTDIVKVNPVPKAGGDVTSPGMWTTLHVDRRDGTLAWDPVGPDGCRYLRAQFFVSKDANVPGNKTWVVRYNPKTKEYVPFTHGDQSCVPDFLGQYRPWVDNGKPVIGIPMYLARGSHLHQGAALCVAPNGDIYVGVTYSPQTDAELEKAGLPRLQPKGLAPICASTLRVYSADGKLKTACALPGLGELEGLRVGRSGAVYVVQPWRLLNQKLPDGLAAGSNYDESRWGSLIKFAGDFKTFPVGRIQGTWEALAPARPTHQGDKRMVKIDGALWTYGGVSPHSGQYSACTCMKASADLDDYERSFVCSAQTCTINVIDSNGNIVARLGGYGNEDSQGDPGLVKDPKTGELRPRREGDPRELQSALRPLAFGLPRNVAVSDNTMWVVDISHRALVRAALVYRAVETMPLP